MSESAGDQSVIHLAFDEVKIITRDVHKWGTVLDLGCGEGHFLKLLQEELHLFGCLVVGVDENVEVLVEAEKTGLYTYLASSSITRFLEALKAFCSGPNTVPVRVSRKFIGGIIKTLDSTCSSSAADGKDDIPFLDESWDRLRDALSGPLPTLVTVLSVISTYELMTILLDHIIFLIRPGDYLVLNIAAMQHELEVNRRNIKQRIQLYLSLDVVSMLTYEYGVEKSGYLLIIKGKKN